MKPSDERGDSDGDSATRSAGGGNDLIQGVAKVLQEASAALAKLNATSGAAVAALSGGSLPSSATSAVGPSADVSGGANLASIAAGIAQAAAALSAGGLGGTTCRAIVPLDNNPLRLEPRSPPRNGASRGGGGGGGGGGGRGDNSDIADFVARHDLDPWMPEVLQMLSPSQRATVMNHRLNMEHARNPTGVIMSRIRQCVSVERRVEMFIQVNDLGEGVVDRLGTLTAEQCEAVMDSGLKLQGATNPSGVAMKRITTVLKSSKGKRGRPIQLSGRREESHRVESEPRRTRSPPHFYGDRDGGVSNSSSEWPNDVRNMVDDLGLENWCGEVLRRLSLWQRQSVARELGGRMTGVRNPSGVVMSRIKHVATTDELVAIFVVINELDRACEQKLWNLTSEQRAAVIAPGIFLQNVRNASTAVRSRIANVLAGKGAMERMPGRGGGEDHGLPGTAVAAATIGAATEVAGAEAARGSAGGGQDRAQAAAMPAIQTMMTAWSRGLAAGGGVGDDG
eukprot:CAMPEP_0115512382 /NCGR_PEP_ID=MMETSP0271-20121206/74480_1 /TAXON_ID=71861 /ORGANISM="Scrippsiella trochoidea, Strain CCMP3099" /LENGTH=508 /DNA_ID=CAMNT_0002942537 /DNA_START=17 /DNA_END=1541 /DNA_ORIENTATION=-